MKKGTQKNKKDLLVSAGYDIITAEASPGRTFEQKGFKTAMRVRGFDEVSAKKVVAKIMNDENEDSNVRLRAADMTFKVEDSYAPEISANVNVHLNTSDPKAIALAREYEAKLREQMNEPSV